MTIDLRFPELKSFAGVNFPTHEGFAHCNLLEYDFLAARNTFIHGGGVSGGFDLHDAASAPREVGLVQITLLVVGSSPENLAQNIETITGMYFQGRGNLLVESPDSTVGDIYCVARMTNVPVRVSPRTDTHLSRALSLTFEVGNPVWLSNTETTTTINATGTSTDDTVTNDGNAPTVPAITINPPSGQTAQNVDVRRIVSSIVRDKIAYTASLTNADTVTYDYMAGTYTENSTAIYGDIYDSLVNIAPPFTLQPGDNTIRVLMANSGDEADVTFTFRDAYV